MRKTCPEMLLDVIMIISDTLYELQNKNAKNAFSALGALRCLAVTQLFDQYAKCGCIVGKA